MPAGLFDGLPNAADLVRRQIIHHHDIAGGEFGNLPIDIELRRAGVARLEPLYQLALISMHLPNRACRWTWRITSHFATRESAFPVRGNPQ